MARSNENGDAVCNNLFLSRIEILGRRERVCFVLAFFNLSKHKILHLEIWNTNHTYRRSRLCPRRDDLEIDLSIVMDKQLKRSSQKII